jgi:uncharacterized C2H2 Zn-finger protein
MNTETESLVCSECGRGFEKKGGLSIHLIRTHGRAPRERRERMAVQSTSRGLDELDREILAARRNGGGVDDGPVKVKEAHACPRCSEVFTSVKVRDRHLTGAHRQVPADGLACPACGEVVGDVCALMTHHEETGHGATVGRTMRAMRSSRTNRVRQVA